MSWTDSAIKKLKPRKRRYRQSDGTNDRRGTGRVVIEIQPNGIKAAYFQYFINGTRKYTRIGRYKQTPKTPGMTLSDIQKEFVRLSNIHEQHGDVNAVIVKEEEAERLEQQKRLSTEITLEHVLDRYLSEKNLKQGTKLDYRKAINQAFPDYLNTPVSAIGREDILKIYQHRAEQSPARANNAMRVYRALYNYQRAVTRQDDGSYLIPENPVGVLSETRLWHKVKRRKNYIEVGQLKPWFNAVLSINTDQYPSGEVVRDLLLFCLLTGVRREEATTLTKSCVDTAKKTFKLVDTKNRETVELPMSDYVCNLIENRLSDSEYVFYGKDISKPIGSLKRPLNNIKQVSGVEFNVHDLRRTFITFAESLDISVYTYKRLVNHKIDESNDVTAGYIGFDIDRMRRATQQITDYILDTSGIRKRSAKVVSLIDSPA